MKKIRVKICGYENGDKFSYSRFLLDVLKKYYQVEFSENPEYVFYNESTYEYLNYDCIRVFYTGENVSPNFNFCDYAIGCDYLTFGDRYYRMPLYLVAQFYNNSELDLAKSLTGAVLPLSGQPDFTKQSVFGKEDLAKKKSFCSFIYKNYLADPAREEMFNKLTEYRRVDAGGRYLNNTGSLAVNKLAFELEHKFSIAFENSSRSGYTTEKLTNALVARTIPIYWGNPDVAKEFNQNRFINCHAYKNFDQVVSKVKEIDQNDELYLKIINEPIGAAGFDFKAARERFNIFLKSIIDQPLNTARRRSINSLRAAELRAGEAMVGKYLKRKYALKTQLAKFYGPFKKIAVLERLKQKILAGRIHKNK